ncbi:MAG TPA: PKD domain-containing protein, partial [Thermoplasmata archaeon]|nr:PKD domain-containing protein [Thermoplasmata archaeon]
NDSVGATGGGNLSVEVAPRLAAALGSIAPAYAGQPVGLSAVGNGGVAPYRVVWSFGDGGTATGPTVQHAYGQAGTYQTEATITDAVGGRSSVAATITVAVDGGSLLGAPGGHLTTPSPSGSIHVPLEIRSATAPSTTPALLAELLGAVVLAALALFLDRGRRGPGPGPSAGWMTRLGRRARRALRPDRRRAR